MNSIRREIRELAILVSSLLASLGFLFAWRQFAIPALSTAFQAGSNSATSIYTLLLSLGIIILAIMGLLIWVGVLTSRLGKLARIVASSEK